MAVPYKPLLKWALERESIRRKRAAGEPAPWTKDPILRDFSFTNVKRAHDKVTQFVYKNVLRPNLDSPEILWFLSMVCRQFNLPSSLQVLIDAGQLSGTKWNGKAALNALEKHRERNPGPLFNAAYMVVAPGGTLNKVQYVCLVRLQDAWNDRKAIFKRLSEAERSMEGQCTALRSVNGLGPFLAYEVTLDLMLTPWLKNAPDLDTWTSLGPGSKRGLGILYGRNLGKYEAIDACQDLLREITARWPAAYPKLHIDDVENLLCEYSKYYRALNGQRPKRLYRGGQGQQPDLFDPR